MYKKIPINIPLIDSLSLEIPIHSCIILDKTLTEDFATFYPTLNNWTDGELHQAKPIIREKKGVKLRFRKKSRYAFKSKRIEEYIVFTISTKILKRQYFEGINKQNIKRVYDNIMKLKIFECTFQTFILGIPSDIDICINRYVNQPSDFEEITKSLKAQAEHKYKYVNRIPLEKNHGIEFNTRSKATPSLPFLKLYFKEWELVYNSEEFNFEYLQDYQQDIQNLTRIEATIAYTPHKKRLFKKGIISEFKTLNDLLDIKANELYRFVTFSLNSYLEIEQRVKSDKFSPTQEIIFQLIQTAILHGEDYESILSLSNHFQGSNKNQTKKGKSIMKKILKEFYDFNIHKSKKLQEKSNKNEVVNTYIRYIRGQNFNTTLLPVIDNR